MTVSQTLGHFIASTPLSSLAAADILAAKGAISDCVGCTIAGAGTEAGRIARHVATASGGAGDATVIGSRRGYAAQVAAQANGTAAHALDYDDILWTLYGHPSVAVLSAALAVAQARAVSGIELIFAYAVGVEVIGKLGRAVNPQHYEHGWHATASIGVIGAAAACARIMGLNGAQCSIAIGIAASQAGGIRRNFGTMTKPLHAGNAARAGVFSAELAEAGFTASPLALEGEYGWARTMNARSIPQAEALRTTLGQPWELTEPGIVLKRYPSCGGTHCALDALIAIRNRHDLRYEEIERIDCDASPFAHKVLLYSRPTTGLEGKFSMEYCLAVAAVHGDTSLHHFEDASTRDPRITGLLPKISFNPRADLGPDTSADAVPAEVTVHARGQRYSQKVLIPSGDTRNPMTQAERRRKFLGCTEGIMEAGRSTALFDALEMLDQATDLKEVGQLLTCAQLEPS